MQKTSSENTQWQRIEAVIEHSRLQSVSAFSQYVGLNRPENLYQIRKGNNGISKDLAEKICAVFPEISKGWLIAGDGQMLPGDDGPEANARNLIKIPLYSIPPVDPGNEPADKIISCSPEICGNAELASYCRDNALLPTYKSGAILYLRKWPESVDLIYGDVYYVITDHFSKFRVVRQGMDCDTLKLTSYSPEYDDMQISRDAIKCLFHVCGASMF